MFVNCNSVSSLWHNNTIWLHRSGSTLVKLIWWQQYIIWDNIIKSLLWNSLENNFIGSAPELNSLRQSDAYMCRYSNQHWFRQWHVAWTVPSHYLNQYWNIVKWTLRNKFQWNFNQNSNISIQENAFENVVCKMASILSQPQCVSPQTS